MQICYPSNLVPSIVGCGTATTGLLFFNSHGPLGLRLGFSLMGGVITSSMCVGLGALNGGATPTCTEVDIFGESENSVDEL